jgi:hypothetical protein
MITLLPDPGTYGAAVIVGLSLTGGLHRRGAVLLRGAFDLKDDGTGIRIMRLSANSERYKLAVSERFAYTSIPDKDLVGESDFVLEKEKADIFVQGFNTPNNSGCLKVDHSIWLQRINKLNPPDPPDPQATADTERNLFGWQGRTEADRSITSEGVAIPKNTLPPAYSAAFNNAYRRSAGFSAKLKAFLPPSALIELFHTVDGSGSAAYSLRLPSTRFGARLRVAGIDCPDQPRRWAVASTFPLRADTLILRPETDQAEMIWRAAWRWDDFDPSRLRGVQIVPV